MINYILMMEAKAFQSNTFHTLHFYKKGEGNEIPVFNLSSYQNFNDGIKDLNLCGFKISTPFTIEEIIINDVGMITVFFFKEDGTFERTGIYRRVAS